MCIRTVVDRMGQSSLDGKDIADHIWFLQSYPTQNDPSAIINTSFDTRYAGTDLFVKELNEHVTMDGGPALSGFSLVACWTR